MRSSWVGPHGDELGVETSPSSGDDGQDLLRANRADWKATAGGLRWGGPRRGDISPTSHHPGHQHHGSTVQAEERKEGGRKVGSRPTLRPQRPCLPALVRILCLRC